MRHRSHRRKWLAKFADNNGMLIFKILLMVLAVALAGLMTYVLTTSRGRF